jgi:hypothetical protein
MANPNDPNAREVSRSSDAGPTASRGPNAGSRPDFERAQTDDAPGHEQRSFQTPPGVDSDDPPEDRYDPTPVEATREREQGLGMGERDLQRQRDPRRPSAPPDEDQRADGE